MKKVRVEKICCDVMSIFLQAQGKQRDGTTGQ